MKPCPATTCNSSMPTMFSRSSDAVLRAVFGNGPYVEGWAVYATDLLLEQGYLNGQSRTTPDLPEASLARPGEHHSRCAATHDGYERPGSSRPDDRPRLPGARRSDREASAREALVRPAPDVLCRLSRLEAPAGPSPPEKGSGYALKEFHESALKEGAVPLPVLSRLLTGKPL